MALNSLSFELRIMSRKRRMRVLQYKKGVKRTLRFVVPAQEAKGGQPLAPILGQVQLNTFEFCTAFNTKTKEYPSGLPVFVELNVHWDKSYSININPFPLLYYLSSFLYLSVDNKWVLSYTDLHKLILIVDNIYGFGYNISTLQSVLGTLSSFGICISPFSEEDHFDQVIYAISQYWDIYFLSTKIATGLGIFNGWLRTNCEDLVSEEDEEEEEEEDDDDVI